MTDVFKNPHLERESFFWPAGQVGVLLCHGYSVAGPLLPGHGTRIEDLNSCRWQDWAGALEATYRQLASHCERVFVGGESLGGLLALYLASEHPEVAGVMTYAAALKLRSKTLPVLIRLLAPFVPVVNKGRSGPSVVDARWQGYGQDGLRAGRQLLKFQRLVAARLHKIAQPILVVQGRLDGSISEAAPDMVYRGVSSQDKQLSWFERSTHCVLIDQEMEDVARLTLEFVARVSAQAA